MNQIFFSYVNQVIRPASLLCICTLFCVFAQTVVRDIGSEDQKVDANYVFSLMSPEYSDHGTSKRVFEESIIDNFQDFLNTVEDESICGNAEAIVWKDGNPSEQASRKN